MTLLYQEVASSSIQMNLVPILIQQTGKLPSIFKITANSYGQSIFATSLIPCQPRDGDGDLPTVFRWPGVFEYEQNASDNIATEGGLFNTSGALPFMIIPGENLLQVDVIDDLNHTVNTSFRASIIEEDREKILIEDTFSCVASDVIQLQSEEGQNGTPLLQTVTARQASIPIEIVLAACAPAFSRSENNECVCDAVCCYRSRHIQIYHSSLSSWILQ